MLTADDRALAQRDPIVPGLATVLDDDALTERVRALVPGRKVEGCRVNYLRYKPGTSCLVGLEVVVDGEPVRGQAKAHRRDDLDKATKVVERARQLLEPSAAVGFDDLVTTTLLPVDVALPVVARLADPERRWRVLRRVVSRRRARAVEAMVPLSYKPERRLVLRLDGPDGPLAVLRCLDPANYRAAVTAATARWDAPVPRHLGHLDRHHLIAVAWVKARRSLAQGWPADDEVAQAVGRAVARLHASPAGGLAMRSPADRARDVVAAGQSVAVVHPDLGHVAERVAATVADRIADLPVGHAALHGDLSPDQLLTGRRGVSIIDLDAARRGDPADDFGSLGASMVADAIRAGRPHDDVRGILDAIVATHGGDVGARVEPFVAAGLLARATEPFRHRWTGWVDGVERVVDAAHAWGRS